MTLNTQPAQQRNNHQHVDWQHLGPEDDYQATDRPSGTARRSRHQREREQQSVHWEEQLPELVFRRTCFLANECQRRQQLQLSMQAEFVERVSTADKECSSCSTAIHLQPVLPAAPITYTGIHAHVTVDKPQFLCMCCGTQLDLHPVSLDCFPATPRRAQVWYDTQMLVATTAAQHSGPTAIQAHCAALKQLHMHNGCGPGQQGIWTNLSTASQQWHRLQVCLCLFEQYAT